MENEYTLKVGSKCHEIKERNPASARMAALYMLNDEKRYNFAVLYYGVRRVATANKFEHTWKFDNIKKS